MTSNASLLSKKSNAPRLSTRLLIVFLALTIIPAIIMSVIPALTQVQHERADQLEALETDANIRARFLKDWVASTQENLREIANDPETRPIITALTVTDPQAPPELASIRQARNTTFFFEQVKAIVKTGGLFNRIVLVTPDGELLSSSDVDINTNRPTFGGELWLTQALRNPGEVVIAGPMSDPVDSAGSLYFALAIRNSDAEAPTGVIVGRVPESALHDVLAKVPVSGDTVEFFLVREGRQYIIPPAGETNMQLASDTIVPTALLGQDGNGEWRDYRGKEVTGVYQWIAPLQMSLIVKKESAAIQSYVFEVIQLQVIVGAAMIVVATAAAFVIARRVVGPLQTLSAIATRVARGDTSVRVPESDSLEFNQLADAFNRMTSTLHSVLDQQESTIKSRTRQLELTSQIGRVISAETDIERLLNTTINMIRDELGYYHAQVFMLDDLRQNAVLRASTGEVGQQLLARGHRLMVSSQSVIGQVTSKGEPVLASDTDRSSVHHRNELLPDTRAELAVPLRIGEEIIGALDVQSVYPDAFDEATIASFRTIADQLAIAIRNSQLFEEKEGLLSASLQLTQTLTRESWDSYMGGRKPDEPVGFKYDLTDVSAMDAGAAESEGGNGRSLALPISLRGQVIGEVAASMAEGVTFNAEDQQLVGQVLERVALALENARLFEQTQTSLMEANRLYTASQAISGANTPQDLVENLMNLAKTDALDRVAVLLLEESDDPLMGRHVRVVARWARDPKDPSGSWPERVPLEEFPLLTQFDAAMKPGGLIINDARSADFSEETRKALGQYQVKALAEFPLITGGRTLGWLLLHATRNANAFSESDIRYYSSAADQAATALEGLRLFEQTETRVRRLQATTEVSRAASSILNPDILLPLTVDKISEAFDYYHAQIFLVDELGEFARLRASTGEVGQELMRREHKLAVGSQSVIGQVTLRGESVIARDTDSDAIHKRNELLPNTRAEMAIPLKTGDRVIGALDVQSTQANAFDIEAQVILQSLADQISVTLENAQLFQEIQDRVAELTTVNLISQAVSRAETLQDLYDVVANQLQRTFGARHALLAVLHEDLIEIPIFLEGGVLLPPIQPIPLGQGLTSHVIRTKEVLLLNENTEEEARRLGAKVIGVVPKSLLAVPLLLGDEIIGVISIQDPEKERAYDETHVRQLTTLAAYIAIKIRNAQLLEEAQRRAEELGFLFNVTRAAVSTTELDEALGNVAGILRDEIKAADAALIYLVAPGEETLEPHAAVGYGRDIAARYTSIPFNVGPLGVAAGHGQPLIISDAQAEAQYASFDERTRAAIVVPLKAGQELIGVAMIASAQPGVFRGSELRLLEAASGTLTAVIQSARLLDQITRANDQLRELDKLKSQFLANMSHELRTPLNSIIGFSRVMLKGIDGALNDLQTQDLNTIYNSGQHLLGLINDILDLSKIEAGKMEIQPEYIAIEEIVDGVMATGKGLIKDKPIQIFKEIEPGLPQVWGDPVRVRQVLLNLVSNASKFTNEGNITIRVTRQPEDPATGEPERAQIDVQDTGIGIAPQDMNKLFEAFRQVDGSTTRQAGGTGLGLAISRQFVEMHGGRMWIESEVGVGTTFSFTVLLHPAALEKPQVVINTKNGDNKPLVMAVDDEPGVLELYGRYLEKGGYAIVGLSNANELMHNIQQFNPSALVLDLNMPGKDGWTAIGEIRKNDVTRNLPIIICSIEDQRERARVAGVNAYLIKPIVEDDLLDTLGQVVAAIVGKTLDVLIVDPDTNWVKQAQTDLEASGLYSVRSAPVGYDALGAMLKPVPDAILLELDLPDMDGYGMLMAMRTQPETKHIPALIVSKRDLSDDELARADPALTQAVSKNNLTANELIAAVQNLLDKTRATASSATD